MVNEAGSYRSPTGPNGEYETHDEWSARTQVEAAAQKREAGLEARLSALETRVEQRFAALERRFKARLGEVTEATRLAFGDLRGEISQQIDEVRERTFAVDDRAEMVRLARQVKACSREVEELRQDIDADKGERLRIAK
ncbi:hypothetical protein I0J99_08330 [Sinorhizobium meliloti]|uniref:hypothetical protein n=1 Tax=Rhizobium meliloti TaxID=382 RepID=UPI000FD8C3DB|nr:hypothetical protein [Sinorhizobium meliloti]TWB05030.1 hypothetical protein FB000_103191 [Ensifer sp. SEMIA 134]TWB35966.1 hypothetical protein FB001_10736 [Ensifer sp. SEMIA 135]QPI27230.1 hypothetical protein I0J99_08330 [Sinorhizobium meliloti]RVG07256.1 hypothetical protein CN234_20225 [Sinorhizobium meliloti]RVL25908.1 hypothetical protein CN147_15270 [Sinorhizobium meliloti]